MVCKMAAPREAKSVETKAECWAARWAEHSSPWREHKTALRRAPTMGAHLDCQRADR